MRPASSRVFVLWITVVSLIAAVFTFNGAASAQASAGSRRKLLRQSLLRQSVLSNASTLTLGTWAAPSAPRPATATDTWTGNGGANTNWSDTSNWNNGAPGGQNILINLTSASTVEDDSPTIGSLTLSNAGDSVTIANGTSLTVGGNISNAGTITLGSTTTFTYLDIGASNVTLSGAGTVVLGSGNVYNIIDATTTGNTLTNQSTIVGMGTIGNGHLVVNNSTGTINANVSGHSLLINPGGASTNGGTLEATNGGTLNLAGSSWTNTGGTISAGSGSAVVLNNGVTVTGGTLTSSGNGIVYGDNATLVGLTNAGNFQVQNGQTTYLSGTINNTGTMTLNSTTTYTYFDVASSNVKLTGSGTLVLGSNNVYNVLDASTTGNTLTNESTIEGEGTIGNGHLVVNNSTGTINANVSGGLLLLNPGGASTNGATMEATNGGTLNLSGSSWTNTGGTITAGSGSAVVLNNNVTVTGGTLNGSGTGVVYGDGATLVGLTTAGNFDIQNGYTTTISGTINNTGTITLGSTTTYTYLDAASGGATLSGGGTVVMGGGAQYAIIDGPGGATFTNSNNTIEGVGNIGNGHLTLVNNGTIDANVSPTVLNSPLIISSGSGGLANTGTLEATNGGFLNISGSSVTNTGSSAVIEALGSDSHGNASYVVLNNGVTINGGKLTTSGAGVIYGDNATLVGVTNAGNFQVQDGQTTYLSGTSNNTGTMTLASSTNYTYLYTSASTTLTGGGTVVMGAGAHYATLDGAGGTTLTNSNNTIEGDGTIGNGHITFVNNGTVNANTNGQVLVLNPVTGTNTATMEATNGGTLNLAGSSWTNAGGTLLAGSGSAVVLNNGVTVTGGTLTTSGTGVVYGNNATLVGLTNAGNFQVQDGQTTYLSGTINNTGTMTLDSSTTYTYFDTAANTTLTGGGTVVMGAGAHYAILDGASGTTLTNSNNTIEGDGTIGNGHITFVNHGTVNANTSGQLLILNPVSGTNTHTMEASNGGTLNLSGSSWTNTGGTLLAGNGSTVVLNNGVTVTGGTLKTSGTGVVYADGATLVGLTNAGNLQVQDGQTAYLSGTINNTGTMTLASSTTYTYLDLAKNTTLMGAGKVVMGAGSIYAIIDGATGLTLTNSGNTIEGDGNIGNGHLVINNKSGSIIANVNGQNLTINSSGSGTSNSGIFEGTNGGNLVVQGTLTNYNGGSNTLTGGTYIANGGNVYLPLGGSGGITALSANVTEENGGQIYNSNNGNNNALNGLTSITATGALTIGGVAFTDTGSFSNAGSLTILAGESFKVGTLTQISGNTLNAGTYVLDGNLSLTGATQNITTNSANLTLAGGTIENANSTSALANLATNNGSLTLANKANFTAAGNFTNNGTLSVNSGSTFGLSGSNVLTNLSSGTLNSGTYVIGGTLQLTSTNGGITTNAANLTLTGTTAKIMDGSSNALAGFNKNTGTFALASGASFTTASSNFSNSGTVNIAKGTTLTVGGTSNSYNQTAGQTTVDGTLSGGTGGSVNITGGTILGAGSIKANVSVGNASGAAATINVGDSGKAGLLSITGTYKQLATGNMTGFINGTTAGSGYSQLKVSGTAALAGTINFTVATKFQATLHVGETFTMLTASSVTGTFSNSTIAINSSFHFNVSYTATGVVLTVASGAAGPAQPAAQVASASAAARSRNPFRSTPLRSWGTGKKSNAILFAGGRQLPGRRQEWPERSERRIWEPLPVRSAFIKPAAVTRDPSAGDAASVRWNAPTRNRWIGPERPISSPSIPAVGWRNGFLDHRVPARIMPSLPRTTR
jgi:fibronectin-binding autotransporter adhesin